MLPSARFEVHAPNTLRRPGQASERVQEGWAQQWAGYGTFKQLSTRSATLELGQAAQLTATARSRAIPALIAKRLVIGSWQVKGPDGTWYEINNRTRSGDLTTLSLTEAEEQHGGDG